MVREYSNREDALVKPQEEYTNKNVLFKENKAKTLTDLIYDEETSADDLPDSEINKLDTSNIKHNFIAGKPSSLINMKSCKSYGVKFNTITDQLDDEYQSRIDFMRKLYCIIIKSKFITGGAKIEGLDEMLPTDSDEEEMAENATHRKRKLGEAAEDSAEDDDDKFLKPHMKNKPTKEDLIKLQKREEFIDENYGYFKQGSYVRVEVEIDRNIANLMDPNKVVTL
jgi:hypothetical protein